MPIKILMPALSPTMEHGNLAKWTKKEGDMVAAGEVIAEIETDKATMEVESVDEGVLAKIVVPEGAEEVPVNSLIAVLLEEDEDPNLVDNFIKESIGSEVSSSSKDTKSNTESNTESDIKLNKEEQEESEESQHMNNNFAQAANNFGQETNNRIFASPLAKRIAKIENVELSNLTGTGPRGRIIKADLLSAVHNISKTNHANSQSQRASQYILDRNPEEYKAIPNNNIRKIIAKRLLESKSTVPHFYLSIECMMDAIVETRAQLNSSFGDDKRQKISINDFVIMATAKALNDVPEANASWSEKEIRLYNNIDISVAVAIDGGLITPVIRNADQKSIMHISSEVKNLAKRARENSLKPEEFQGGGFSISNLGMYGVKSFNAIVNPPQACILAVGMSSKRAVVIDDKIEIRTIMDVSLSCDHRVVDGAIGAKFLAAFKQYIESPILMFV